MGSFYSSLLHILDITRGHGTRDHSNSKSFELVDIASPQSDLEMDSSCFLGALLLREGYKPLSESNAESMWIFISWGYRACETNYSQCFNRVIFASQHDLYSQLPHGISETAEWSASCFIPSLVTQ